MLDRLDLLDPQLLADPYAVYDRLREQAPVHEMPDVGFFLVTRHAAVVEALRDEERFGVEGGQVPPQELLHYPEARAVWVEQGLAAPSPLRADAAGHASLRASLDGSLEARLTASEARIRAIAQDLLRALEGREDCDFVSELCVPLPLMGMADLLGLELDDVPRLLRGARDWRRPFAGELTVEGEQELARRRGDLRRHLAEAIAQRRRSPDDDLLSDLVRAADAGAVAMDDAILAALTEELLYAGNDAAGDALASGMLLLLRDPHLAETLREDRSLVPAFVEESLRLESPVAGLLRRATRDTELLGVAIPAGRLVHLRLAAANRDPRVFEAADRLDLARRDVASHLAFGDGSRHCPGAALARLVLRVGFEGVLEQWRKPELAVSPSELTYLPSFAQRSLRELPLRLG